MILLPVNYSFFGHGRISVYSDCHRICNIDQCKEYAVHLFALK